MGGDPASMSVGLVCANCGEEQHLWTVLESCPVRYPKKHVWVSIEEPSPIDEGDCA